MERKNRRRRKDTEQAIQSLQAEHKQLKEYCVNESGVVKTTTYCEVVARWQNEKH